MNKHPYRTPLENWLQNKKLRGEVFPKPDMLCGQVAHENSVTRRYDDYVWITFDHPQSGYARVYGLSPTGTISRFEVQDTIYELSDEGPIHCQAMNAGEVIAFLESDLLSDGQ